jgi:GNAT superfamily N-acetyltransferase
MPDLAFTLEEKPSFREGIETLGRECWPEFLLHGNVPGWKSLFADFARFQVLLCDREDRLVAAGHAVPISWNGTVVDLPPTIAGILQRALAARTRGDGANALAALAAMVSPRRRGKGLSRRLIESMLALGRAHGLQSLLAPVRPTAKSLYPLLPMEDYAGLTRADGAPFDPWIRVHWRLGAVALGVAPATLVVEGTVADWRAWTGMEFPESGEHIVPGALQPVHIDRERDLGRYEDPNLWMRHRIAPPDAPC